MTAPDPSTSAIVLAAGLGTRMRSRTPKVLHPICGRPMLAYVLDVARQATGGPPIVVVSVATADVQETFGSEATFVLQAEPRGTGDALRVGLEALPAETSDVVVLSGDTPLFEADTVRRLAEQRRQDGAVLTLASFRPEEAGDYGRIVRDGDRVRRIVEMKDASNAELGIEEVNAGLYAFDAAWLRARIGDLSVSPASGEIYLTELVSLAVADGQSVTVFEVEDELEPLGVDDRLKLATAEAEIRWRILERHLDAGVTMLDPTSTYVEAEVELSEDVILEPSVALRGRTRVGRETVVGRGSEIVDSIVGERCRIRASVIESSQVDDDVSIGPFSHLRRGASIGAGAEVGNFAEIKEARLGAGSKQHHFSYLGDADVGREVNIGAGTITANFDGRRKHRTVIGDRAFIGSDTILRAPVTIGQEAATGAGSVVTRDVPDGKLAVGMPARVRERRSQGSHEPDPAQDA